MGQTSNPPSGHSRKELSRNRFITIEYDEVLSSLIVVWKGYFSSEEYKEANLKILDFSRTMHFPHIISNVRESAMVKPEDTRWAEEHIIPGMVALGLRKASFVLAESIFTSLSLSNFKQGAERNSNGLLETMAFQTQEAAEAWLAAKIKTVK